MMDILNWIGNNGGAVMGLGILLIVVIAILCSFVVGFVRAITGKYPPPAICSCDCEDEEEEDASN